MKRIVLLSLIIINTIFANEFIDIPLKDYIKIVSNQQNISIVIDKNIDSNYSIFLSSKLDKSVYFEILKTILTQENMMLKHYKHYYYITTKTKETSNKNKVFSYTFYYLTESDIKDFMSIYNYKYKYVKNLKTIFIDCSLEEYKDLIKQFKKFDLIPRQKKLKITVLDTNLTKVKEYGFKNEFNLKENANQSFFFNLLTYPFSTTNILPTNSKSNFSAFIKFMNNKNFTKILSSPTITIFNNKKTYFEVVKNIPYKTGQTVSNDDITKTTTAIEYKDVGLKLEVLPSINNTQAFIDLSLTVENILDNSDTPITSKRHFKQYVSLKSGETFILNGINQSETFKEEYKTPVLSDIPYIGWLFKNKIENVKSSNLTVLIELY